MIKYLIQYDKENPVKENVFKVTIHLMVGVYSFEFEENFRNQENTTELEIERQLSNAVVIKEEDGSFIYQEDTFTEKPNFDLINKKNELIRARQITLNQNKDIFIKMFRDFLLTVAGSENPATEIITIANQNKTFCENDLKIEDEILEIEVATSLEELNKFA